MLLKLYFQLFTYKFFSVNLFFNFRLLMTDDQIDLYIVHLGGLTLDMFAGFLLFFDKTRPLAFFFVGSFHFMNSQMFSIGMV